jgi:hypothetical protein
MSIQSMVQISPSANWILSANYQTSASFICSPKAAQRSVRQARHMLAGSPSSRAYNLLLVLLLLLRIRSRVHRLSVDA